MASVLLIEKGHQQTTMLAVAERARTSKETLYAWFGDKAGLFGALVLHHASAMNELLAEAMTRTTDDPRATLERFGEASGIAAPGPT